MNIQQKSTVSGIDEIYHAIGRFTVEFSTLNRVLEMCVMYALAGFKNRAGLQRSAVVATGMGIQQLVKSFFTICRDLKRGDWSSEDFEIVDNLRNEIESLIQRRNKISHHFWYVHQLSGNRTKVTLLGETQSVKTGSSLKSENITVDDINLLIEQIDRLWRVLHVVRVMISDPTNQEAPTTTLEMFEGNKVRFIQRPNG